MFSIYFMVLFFYGARNVILVPDMSSALRSCDVTTTATEPWITAPSAVWREKSNQKMKVYTGVFKSFSTLSMSILYVRGTPLLY